MADADAAREPFAARLRRRTNRRRTATQAVSNLTVPLALSSEAVYAVVLRSYLAIFAAFEDEFEKRRRVYPRLNAVHFRQLLRAKAFADDLSFFAGDGAGAAAATAAAAGESVVSARSPATDAFVRDMRAALAREPALVIAYSYALYMGLVTASARVVPWVRAAFDIDGPGGVAIWDFSATIHNVPAFRKAYDKALSAFPVDEELEDRIVHQVHHIFEGSTAIFAEIRASAQYSRRVRVLLFRGMLGAALVAFVSWFWFDAFVWAFSSTFLDSSM